MIRSEVHEVKVLDDVHLVVPAASEFLRVLRLAAADAAARAGLDCEAVEDFRIAVDELSHATMTGTDHHVHVTFRSERGQVTARGSARNRGGTVPARMSDLSRTIVAAACDHFEFEDARREITFAVVKSEPSLRERHPMVDRA